jgi:signal transduction histidine kinase
MKKKIIIGLSMLFFLFLSGGLMAVLHIGNTTNRLDRIIQLHKVGMQREDLVIRIQQVASNRNALGTRYNRRLDEIVSDVKRLEEAARGCQSCHHGPDVSERIEELIVQTENYKRALSRMITTSANIIRLGLLEDETVRIEADLLKVAKEAAFTANRRLEEKTAVALGSIKEAQGILYCTLAGGLLSAIVIAFFLMRSLTKPLNELLLATGKIASGNLDHRIRLDSKDEFEELANSFNVMAEGLKKSQLQLIQSAKLAAIGELASNIAHEINNPLTSILGYTGLIKAETDPNARMEDLEIIEKEALRAREIIKNLLDFARQTPLKIEEANINSVLKTVLSLTKSQAKAGNIEVIEELKENLPSIPIDINQMKQVFINIINNAISAMPGGGKLWILADTDGKGFIKVSFKDTGIGIPEEHLIRIFDPFFTTKDDTSGTGLGLSISYGIVERHGGNIEVESKVGEGSTFTIKLPVGAEKPAPNI